MYFVILFPLKNTLEKYFITLLCNVSFTDLQLCFQSRLYTTIIVIIDKFFILSQTFGFNVDLIFALSTNTSSPRTELLININNQRRGSERPGSPFDVRLTAGLRIGNWKLLTGNGGVGRN